jgi:hypothetical protein
VQTESEMKTVGTQTDREEVDGESGMRTVRVIANEAGPKYPLTDDTQEALG